MTPRIYVILRGGLGNQLHQIAAGVKYGEINGGKVKIYARIVDNSIDRNRRGFFREIDLTQTFYRMNISEVNRLEEFFISILIRTEHMENNSFVVKEKDFSIARNHVLTFLIGWFQSFDFLPNHLNPNALVVHSGDEIKSITIHIRLTDFAKIDENPLASNYYVDSLKLIGGLNTNQQKQCFSDDIPEAMEMLKKIPHLEFPELRHELKPPSLLAALANSQILVCSRSSLCWWAAVIVSFNHGIVVSPWVGPANHANWLTATRKL